MVALGQSGPPAVYLCCVVSQAGNITLLARGEVVLGQGDFFFFGEQLQMTGEAPLDDHHIVENISLLLLLLVETELLQQRRLPLS